MWAILRIVSTTCDYGVTDFIVHVHPMSRGSKVDCFAESSNAVIYKAKEINSERTGDKERNDSIM